MSVGFHTTQIPTRPPLPRWLKPALWTVMGAMTISVLLYSEIRLLLQAQEQAYLRTILFYIVPHAMAGVVALLAGPLQFSGRLRRRHPVFHRVLGRLYVSAVFICAPLAIVMSNHRRDPHAIYFVVATVIQAGTWIITTAAAFLTARNRHFQQHREWMIRSYAVTFTFVGIRFPQPLAFWNHHTEASFAMAIIIVTFLAVLIPDLAFHWREFSTRRA